MSDNNSVCGRGKLMRGSPQCEWLEGGGGGGGGINMLVDMCLISYLFAGQEY